MVSKRNKISAVLFLTALSLFAVTSAFGGTIVTNPTTFAAEPVGPTTTLTLQDQCYTVGISRSSGQNFLVRFTLGPDAQGPLFTGTLADSNLLVSTKPPDQLSWLADGSGHGTNFADFEVYVYAPTDPADSIVLCLHDAKIIWTTPTAVACPKLPSLTLTVTIYDLYGNPVSAIDRDGKHTGTIAFLQSAASFEACGKCTTVDTVFHRNGDTHSPGTVFEIGNHDDLLVAEHMICLSSTTSGVMDSTGLNDYSLNSTDSVVITVTGDFTGLATNGFGFDDGTDHVMAGTVFTIDSTKTIATLLLTGDKLATLYHYPCPILIFIADGKTLLFPRDFNITVTVTGGKSGITNTLCNECDPVVWWTWNINGTLLTSIYATNYPDSNGNCTKFRFINWTGSPITMIVDPHIGVMLDQGTFAFVTTDPALWSVDHVQFLVPPHAVKQVSLTCAPMAGTGELGPMITILTGTPPIRSTVTFVAAAWSKQVDGLELISSPSNPIPSGVIITEEMLKNGSEGRCTVRDNKGPATLEE